MADPYQLDEEFLNTAKGRQLLSRSLQMYGQQPDVTALNEYAAQRQQQARMSMLNSLAAQYAGKGFEPMQGALLKRSMEAYAPEKFGDYGMVANGRFIADPYALRDKQAAAMTRLGENVYGAENDEAKQKAADARAAAREAAMDARAAAREAALFRRQEAALEAAERRAQQRYDQQNPRYEPVPMSGIDRQPQIVTTDVEPGEALGLKGVWQSGVNRALDAAGFGNAQDPNRVATERLESLANQTQLYLQDAVPGRPSNYLLQMMERQAIRPNNLFVGGATGAARAKATMGVIDTGINDLANIINNPQSYSKTDVAKARQGYARLSQLKSEYRALAKAFDEGSAPASAQPAQQADQDVDAIVDMYLKPRGR